MLLGRLARVKQASALDVTSKRLPCQTSIDRKRKHADRARWGVFRVQCRVSLTATALAQSVGRHVRWGSLWRTLAAHGTEPHEWSKRQLGWRASVWPCRAWTAKEDADMRRRRRHRRMRVQEPAGGQYGEAGETTLRQDEPRAKVAPFPQAARPGLGWHHGTGGSCWAARGLWRQSQDRRHTADAIAPFAAYCLGLELIHHGHLRAKDIPVPAIMGRHRGVAVLRWRWWGEQAGCAHLFFGAGSCLGKAGSVAGAGIGSRLHGLRAQHNASDGWRRSMW